MEPNDVVKPANNPAPVEPLNASNDDLHAEGIDVVGSAISFDNEFSTGATDERIATPTPLPEQTVSETATIPEDVTTPVVPQAPKEMPMTAKQAFYAPAPLRPLTPPATPKSRDDASIKPLRTFKSDAEEAVKYGGVSKVSIAVAEQKKRDGANQTESVGEKRSLAGIFLLLLLILIMAGGGGWYYWTTLSKKPQSGITRTAAKISTILPYSKGTIALVDPLGTPLQTIQAKLLTADAGLGNIFAVLPVLAATSTSQAPISSIFTGTHIPSRLARSLADSYMFGTYVYDMESPFLILKNTFYQNAFSGMLEWEKELKNDLSGFTQQSYPKADIGALDNAVWTDTVVSNIDVREIKDASGKVMLAYAFADKDTIVLTTSESSLKYLLDRLLQVRTIQ